MAKLSDSNVDDVYGFSQLPSSIDKYSPDREKQQAKIFSPSELLNHGFNDSLPIEVKTGSIGTHNKGSFDGDELDSKESDVGIDNKIEELKQS